MRPRHFGIIVAGALVLAFPWLPGIPLSYVIHANLAGEYAVIAISIVVLTGWVGQISLGQGAFVGIGAFSTALVVRGWHIPFPINLPIVSLIVAAVAAVLGLVALRVRGLYLAVATLIFAWMCDAYLFSSSWFVGKGGGTAVPGQVVGRPGSITHFDLRNKRVFYYLVLAVVVAVCFAVQSIRDSKTGRAFFAVRGSEMAAVSLGISVTRYKLIAFAFSGALAGLAGNILMTDARTATPPNFQFTVSLFYLSIAVVGGIASLGGAVAASILFAALNEAFFRVAVLNGLLDVISVGLLLLVLLAYPAGLGGLGSAFVVRLGAVSTRFARWAGKGRSARRGLEIADSQIRVGEQPIPGFARQLASRLAIPVRRSVFAVGRNLPQFGRRRVARRVLDLSGVGIDAEDGRSLIVEAVKPPPPVAVMDWRRADVSTPQLRALREDRTPVLDARSVTVRFGGLTAVNDVSLAVREHEIVGLIGPNGAGKTTLFNAISGLNEPAEGRIVIFGEDATTYSVDVRAQMGVGRTFQLIQLFPQLTVFENLLVATHAHNPTGFFSHLAVTGRAVEAERQARRLVHQIISVIGLDAVADRSVAGLPFGILRRVEIARALVTRSPLLMLDEPASGLDNSETDELAQLLRFLRSHLGVTILLIEHDVRMVTSVCDHIYVIDQGRLLAEGTPAEIQQNAEVVAAYLGADTSEAERVSELEPV